MVILFSIQATSFFLSNSEFLIDCYSLSLLLILKLPPGGRGPGRKIICGGELGGGHRRRGRSTLKKPQLDCDDLNNYQPVFNVPYIPKLIERVVAIQLNDHMSAHSLMESLQSAYHQGHSTETALTFIAKDVLCAADKE